MTQAAVLAAGAVYPAAAQVARQQAARWQILSSLNYNAEDDVNSFPEVRAYSDQCRTLPAPVAPHLQFDLCVQSWAYRLYAKSKIVVHYSIEGAAGITFVILRGEEALHDWKESPLRYQAYEYQTFLHGKGRAPDLGEDPFTAAADGDYFFVFGNLQRSRIKMNVTFVVESLVYDIPGDADDDDEVTTCDLRKHGKCSVYMPLFSRRYAVVATPDSFMGASVWHVTVSYGNRWRAYFLSVGVVLLVLLCTMACMKKRLQYQYDGYEEVRPGSPHAHFPGGSQNASGQDIDGGLHPDYSVGPWRPISSPPPPPPPLLAPQYSPFQMPSPEVPPGAPSGAGTAFPMPSFPYQDPANPNVSRDHMPHGYVAEGEATSAGDLAPSAPPMEKEPWNKDEKAAEKEKGTVTKPRHLRLENPCAVCFDAPKDAIFDPCGHRATCHGCAVRLQESKTAQCPICRVQINQVIKVFDT
ncbi:hypothetical protein CBR_g30911 [Chara braunii]|uniref:RING-type domain-containing protein n=1 Tax=Chara braunii TaxID=69332 RepID=A0A388LDU8_CHABU|nr:hypothetical protein CBR_g30911 [Chara braunii]|eukprot:GBG80447.1 hypothetical protein CBR_g30911 [Chara braunii]